MKWLTNAENPASSSPLHEAFSGFQVAAYDFPKAVGEAVEEWNRVG